MKFNWIGKGFLYGEYMNFFSITAFNVEQVFYIYKTLDEDETFIFNIKNADKIEKNTIETSEDIGENVNYIHLIETDEWFRKKYKRSYNLIKFECENDIIITIGTYTDSRNIPTPNNSYLLCGSDFVNVLAESRYIWSSKDIYNTPFHNLASILNKNELTKQLLK